MLYSRFSRTPGNPDYLFYRSSISLISVCTSSKLSSTFNSNITYLTRNNSKRGIIGALSARPYNATVQGSDAWISNHFIKVMIWFFTFLSTNNTQVLLNGRLLFLKANSTIAYNLSLQQGLSFFTYSLWLCGAVFSEIVKMLALPREFVY